MSRRLANRPRHQQARVYPQPLRHPHKDYLRQRWTYRQQRELFSPRPLGYGLTQLPWGWRPMRTLNRRRA